MTTDKTTNPWDEAVLEVALEEVFAEAAEEVPPHANRRRPALLAAAALLIVALVAVLNREGSDPAGTSAQDPITNQDPATADSWGLHPGSEWVYRTQSGNSSWTEAWCANGWIHSEGAPPVLQLMLLEEGRTTYRHLGRNKDGLVEYAPAAGAQHPVFEPNRPFLILPLRVGIRTGWSTTQSYEASVSVGNGPVGLGYYEQRDRKLEGALEAPEVKITVPAGTFSCTRIRYEHTEDDGHAFETWWSPVAGRVKEVVFEKGVAVRTTELERFRKGNAKIDARATVAAATIRSWCDANLGEQVEWTWVVPSSVRPAPKSRFALIPVQDGYRVLRVHGDQAREFDWSDKEHVHAWLSDENWFRKETESAHPVLVTGVAVLLARCRAESKGLFLLEPGEKTVSLGNDGTVGAEVRCDLESFSDRSRAGTFRMKVELTKHGKVVALLIQ